MFVNINFNDDRLGIAPANDNYPAEFLDEEFWADIIP